MDVLDYQPLLAPVEQLNQIGAVLIRVADGERAPRHADDRAAFEHDHVERKAGDLTGGEANYEIASLPSHGAQSRLCVRPADAVVEHIDTVSLRQLFQPVLEVFDLIVDALDRAVCLGEGKLVAGRSNRNNATADELSDFDRGEPCTTSGTKNGDGLTWLQMPAIFQPVQRGAVGHGHAGGGLITYAFGNRDRVSCLGDHQLLRAVAADRGRNPLAQRHV